MPDLYAIIRIRGRLDVPRDVDYTLKLLRLHKKFHMVIYPSDQPGLKGMLQKAKDWITWGEINYETLVELLRKRGRTLGNKPLTDEFVDKYLSKYGIYGGIQGLAKALFEGKIKLHKLEIIKPVFRLHPPRGGFKRSTKRPFNDGGELGYRGKSINELIKRML
ncbi:50S ribosomal protein L30 [Staphylothermus hellenicus]|uniref:Large ribosomal subunit protein uL30 n=1 Tax=Staphylothermus hellenicus (strain DSM 12710 / JCM 10830 / BK20S6-10-b1 / P8) TaxID=591019 RepID=D7D9R5_STAHD|nr:50S ribosomal protein L30 [Staphylothermus hellenicus]ADI32511.1 ribosomal protein L30P [Staphylothermus hellenicus DSM 12710]